ncbi:MAG: hypothetical protein ABW203_05210 [Novosphingobium sp.]
MMQRVGTGWQVLLADLALILFIVTAASLSNDEANRTARAATPAQRSTAVAVYRAEADAPPLRGWLAAQAPDARQMLTIWSPYAPGRQREALAKAEAMSREAGPLGVAVRIVVEPGSGPPTATLAYDAAP